MAKTPKKMTDGCKNGSCKKPCILPEGCGGGKKKGKGGKKRGG